MANKTTQLAEALTWARAASDTDLSYAVRTGLHAEANDGERATYGAACQVATERGLACVRYYGAK